jgi:AcrR family transcriptional regulator
MTDPGNSRDRIKREAMRLFVEHGVDAVSMRDIAEATGMKAPSLYAHFRSRQALIADLFVASYTEYGRRLAEAAASHTGCRAQVEAMVRVICALHAEDELLFNFLLVTQHGTLNEAMPDDANPVEIICRCIAAGMENGDIPARDPTLIAAAITGTIVQSATFRLYKRLDRGLAAHTQALVDTCLRIVS